MILSISNPNRSKELLLKGLTRFIILTFLEKNEMTGYSVLKKLEDLIGIKLHAGTVYPLLYELERSGLIVSTEVRKGRRILKYYKISEGVEELLEKARSMIRRALNRTY